METIDTHVAGDSTKQATNLGLSAGDAREQDFPRTSGRHSEPSPGCVMRAASRLDDTL